MFVVVSGCFLVEIGCLGCKYAVWCDIWQVWVFPRTLHLGAMTEPCYVEVCVIVSGAKKVDM